MNALNAMLIVNFKEIQQRQFWYFFPCGGPPVHVHTVSIG